jgi:hypothetical protein
LLTNPFTLLDLSNFLYWAGWEARHYGVTGHPGAEGPTGIPQVWHHLRFVASWQGVGPLAFLASAAGVVGLWRRSRHPAAIVAVFPGLLLLLLATQKVNFTRNLLAAYPAIAIVAGLGCAAAIERMRAVRGTGRRTLVLAVLTAGLFGPLLARASVDMSTAVRYRNPQDLVTGWLHVNSRPGATVAIAAQIPWSARDLDTAGFDVVQFDVGRTDPAALSRVDYVVMARHWRTALQPLVRSPFDWGRYLDESANVRVCYGRAPVRTELNENPLLCIVNPPTAEQVRALGGGGQGEIDTTRPGPRPGGPTVLGLAAGGASTASPQTPVSGWPPEPLAPDDGASVGTLQPMLRVRNAAWPAPVTGATYRFEISTSPDFRENRLVFEGVPEGPSFTDVHINRSLDPATLYFWRVRAAAARALSPHSEVWSFRTPRAADVQK